MNNNQDSAELLDDAITMLIERGTNTLVGQATAIQNADTLNIVREVRVLAESTPMRATFLSELEAQLIKMPATDHVRSSDRVSSTSEQEAPGGWHKVKNRIGGWTKWRKDRQTASGRSDQYKTPRLGLAGLLILVVLAASASLLIVRQAGTATKSKATPTVTATTTVIATSTATVIASPTRIPAQVGMVLPLGEGATIQMINQVQAAVVGRKQGSCGMEMTWVLQISNTSNKVFTATIDNASPRMTDITGKSYPLSTCNGSPFSGSFVEPSTLAVGDVLKGVITFQADNVPVAVNYFDLSVTVSGVPVVFRYDFPRSVVQAPSTPTQISGSSPLSLVKDGNGYRLDVYEGTARFDDSIWRKGTWIEPSRLLVHWYFASDQASATGVYSYATYVIDTKMNMLMRLPDYATGSRLISSPDGKRAIVVKDNSSVQVALYDYESGNLEVVADQAEIPQWAGPDAKLSDFKPGTEVFTRVTPMWAGNDKFALTLDRSSEGGSEYAKSRALLVDISKREVRVLAGEGKIAATFADGAVLVQAGKHDGAIQLFMPGESEPTEVGPAGLWTFDWSLSPDGKRVAWLEIMPIPGDWRTGFPGTCCGDTVRPTVKDVVLLNYDIGVGGASYTLQRRTIDNYAWTMPQYWPGGAHLRWSKDNGDLFYASYDVQGRTSLHKLLSVSKRSAIAEVDGVVGIEVVAEGDDGSIYFTVSGQDCSQCVQLMRAYPDGNAVSLFINSIPRTWWVNEKGYLEVLKDGGVSITDLSTNQVYQVNFPGVLLTDDMLGLTKINGLVDISPDGSWAAYSGTQSSDYSVERGRTVYIVKVK